MTPSIQAHIASLSSEKRRHTLGYFGSFIILGFAAAIVGPSLPHLAENTGTLINEISALFLTRSTGYFIGSWIAGHLYDRFAGHRVLSFGLILTIVMLILIPELSVLWLLTLVMLMLGLAEGIIDVGGNALLVWVHRDGVGPYITALHSFFGVGSFLAPIFIAQSLLMRGDIDLGYWLVAALIVPVVIWIGRLDSPVSPAKTHQRKSEGESSLRSALIPILGTVLLLFLYVGVEMGFGGWVYTYALEMGLANQSEAAYITSAYWGAFTVFRFLSIILARYMRPRTMLFADLIGGLISVGIILLWPHSNTALWLGSIMLGACLASVFPTAITLAERRTTLTAQITSWFFIGGGLGSMFFPWFMGQIFTSVSPQSTMVTLLAILALAILLLFGIVKQPRKETA
jgi:MFS transporter, FHS family, Na+ dependent glucose transporter 1